MPWPLQAVTELLENAWHDGSGRAHAGPLRASAPDPQRLHPVDRRRSAPPWGDRHHRRHLRAPASRGDPPGLRRQRQPRALKTPMGALGLLAETLTVEPDPEIGQRLASRIHTEAFRVSRIIDDLLDLTRIESEEAPPREPIYINLVMAEAVERVQSAAEQAEDHHRAARAGAPRPRPRRPPPAGVGHPQPARERCHLLLRERHHRGHRQPARRRGPPLGGRFGGGHPGPGPGADLRALLPGRPRGGAGKRAAPGCGPLHRPPRGQ